jgi:RND family efflux transporter MFP subunit
MRNRPRFSEQCGVSRRFLFLLAAPKEKESGGKRRTPKAPLPEPSSPIKLTGEVEAAIQLTPRRTIVMTLTRRTLVYGLTALLLAAGSFLPTAGAPPKSSSDKPDSAPARAQGFLVVQAVYPGANASVVADTVAAPVEKEINGVEDLVQMSSRCTNDGRYTLLLTFKPGVDFDIKQVLVQNRVALATPALPEEVNRQGLSVKKLTPGVLVFVTLYSPDNRFDTLYLGRYASLQVEIELQRLPGAGDVARFGVEDIGVRVLLDPKRLEARELTANDVLKALREQNLKAFPGKGSQIVLSPPAKLTDPDKIADTVLRTGPGAGIVYLRDVASVELGATTSQGHALLDGKPVVALGVVALPKANPRDLSAAVRKRMEELKKEFPKGVDYTLAFDLAPPDAKDQSAGPQCVLIEEVLPPAASAERAAKVLDRYSQVALKAEGVQHALALPENPFARFRGGPCVVALLAPDTKPADREKLTKTLRAQLEKVEGAEPRLRDLSGPEGARPDGYPLDLAVRGPDTKSVNEFAAKLSERLARNRRLTDVSGGPAELNFLTIDLDRKKAAEMGLAVSDIFDTLQTYLGAANVGDLGAPGRTLSAQVRLEGRAAPAVEDMKKLRVRNEKGDMVPLGALAAFRESAGPAAVERLDDRPAAFLAANPAPGTSLGEARWLCEALAAQVRKDLRLSDEYRLIWMRELPAAKAIPGEPKDDPPPEVKVGKPVSREVTDHADFTGRLDAAESVDLRPRVSGYVTKVAFKEGAAVKKGDLLFEIDPRPYQAQLDQALAQVALAEASLKLAKTTLDRDTALAKAAKETVSQQQLDQDKAAVEEAEARRAAARAVAEVHKLNLDFTKITSPIDGRIGRTNMTPGNLVVQDQTQLATVVSLDPVFVYFDVDEATLLKIKNLGEKEQPALVGLSTEEGHPRKGVVNFVNNVVNPQTGALSVRAVLANKDGALRPGTFARVRLPLGAPHKALLVPEKAVNTNQGVKFVLVVDDKDKVVYRPVEVGALHDGLRVIEKGLQPDERVILDDVNKLNSGMTVKPVKAP